MRRGEIWWGEAPEHGRRPYLVITRDRSISVLNKLIVVPATRNVRDIATQVRLDVEDGVPYPCALAFDNITTIRKALLTERIAMLGPAKLHRLCKALAVAVDC
jgi:mRNA-degrading endonuclease toxin of MazEF toxin-antitoxin module